MDRNKDTVSNTDESINSSMSRDEQYKKEIKNLEQSMGLSTESKNLFVRKKRKKIDNPFNSSKGSISNSSQASGQISTNGATLESSSSQEPVNLQKNFEYTKNVNQALQNTQTPSNNYVNSRSPNYIPQQQYYQQMMMFGGFTPEMYQMQMNMQYKYPQVYQFGPNFDPGMMANFQQNQRYQMSTKTVRKKNRNKNRNSKQQAPHTFEPILENLEPIPNYVPRDPKPNEEMKEENNFNDEGKNDGLNDFEDALENVVNQFELPPEFQTIDINEIQKKKELINPVYATPNPLMMMKKINQNKKFLYEPNFHGISNIQKTNQKKSKDDIFDMVDPNFICKPPCF